MSAKDSVVLWFRKDLRLYDNPALNRAVRSNVALIPVYIWSPEEEGVWPPGAAARWWLHHSLRSLAADLDKLGSKLIIRKGRSLEVLRVLLKETGAGKVLWNRRYEPFIIRRDQKISDTLNKDGIITEGFNGSLLYEPWEIENNSGKPYQVFTAYWKKCLSVHETFTTVPSPRKLNAPGKWPGTLQVSELKLEPESNWSDKLGEYWKPGSKGAKAELRRFADGPVFDYKQNRDLPYMKGTSRLSPYLCNGEISPNQIWKTIMKKVRDAETKGTRDRAMVFLRQLIWREFSYHLLYHYPDIPSNPLRKEFAKFPWKSDKISIRAWQRGLTGYPIVDAGMRELWETGWMHNRVRMITASFLTKDLLIPWQEGAKWFWDTLVDADLANNTFGWQWTAGCGADASPYFRIFNPVLQGEKFDPAGRYVRTWVPELAGLLDRWIHKPWTAPEDVLEAGKIQLGNTYPDPIVDHGMARNLALEIYKNKIKPK